MGWYVDTPMFEWSTSQPVKQVWLVCGEAGLLPKNPDHVFRVSSETFYSDGQNSGKVQFSLRPNTTLDCNVQTSKEGTDKLLISNTVRVETGPLN